MPALPNHKRFAWGLLVALPLLLAGLLGSCARVVPPGGGPKDSLPPRLVRSVPSQGQTGYKGRTVSLEFDEWVAINGIMQQLIVSPVQDNAYTFKQKGRRLTLTFEKEFPDSATVFLNFRNAVTDINEKLPAKDLRLAFATGARLDTILVQGQVSALLTSKPVAGTTVGLWPWRDTTDIRRQRPQYLALADAQGIYRLENVRAGRYQLAAFTDANNNARWSGKREALAFVPGPLPVQGDTTVPLTLATVDEDAPRLERVAAAAGRQVEVRFAEGLQNLTALRNTDTIARQPTDATGATFRLYLPQAWADTLSLRLLAVDSTGNKTDTLVRIAPYKAPRGAKTDTAKVVLRARPEGPAAGNGYYLPTTATVTLPEPLRPGSALPTLALRADSQPKARTVKPTVNRFYNRLTFDLPVGATRFYTLYLGQGGLLASGAALRADTFNLPLLAEEQVGLIRGRLAAAFAHTILEVLNDQGVAVRTLYDAKTFELLGLPPGNYTFRLTVDENGNRKRDLPSYNQRTPGERVLPPTLPVQVKANWEVEVGDLFAAAP